MVAMIYVDKVKRNYLIGTGFALCCCCLIIFTALVKTYVTEGTNKSALGAAAAILFLYVTSFELCLDGPEFFYQAEIWPSHLRAKGFTIGIALYSGINIVWLQAAPTAFAHIGWKYYLFFIVFSAMGSLTAFFVFPDTLHKPLEEIAAMFGDHDLVVLYQKDLDNSEVALSTIEEVIPGLGHGTADDVSSEKLGARGIAIEKEEKSV